MRTKNCFLLCLMVFSLIYLRSISAAPGKCSVSGEGLFKLTDVDKITGVDCNSAVCYRVDGDNAKLSFEGVDTYNLRKGSVVKCSSTGELLSGTDIKFGTKGFSDSYSVKIPGGILLSGVSSGDRLKIDEYSPVFTKGSDNVKKVGEAGKKDFQVNPVEICGQKIDAPLGKDSFFLIKKSENAKNKCEIESYVVSGSEFSKEIQTSSYKCGDRDLKLNGVALNNGKSFRCGALKGNIECVVPECFENIAGFYNLDIDGIKFQNLKGFISYKYENTGVYKIEGNNVIADFKGADVHCNTDECLFKDKDTMIYKPKSGAGKIGTGGSEIVLPGLINIQIKPQKFEKVTSPTGCFIVQEKGRLSQITSNEYKNLGCTANPVRIKVPFVSAETDEGRSVNIELPADKSIYYSAEDESLKLELEAISEKEPKPEAGIIGRGVREIIATPKCNEKFYYFPENNLRVCLTEDEAKKAFEPICRHYEDSCLNEDEIEEAIRKHMTDLISNPQTAPHFPTIEDNLKVTTETEPDYLVFSSGECIANDVRCSERYGNGLYSFEVCTFDQSSNKFYWKRAEIPGTSLFYRDRHCFTPVSNTKVKDCQSDKKNYGYRDDILCMNNEEAKKAFEPLINKLPKVKMKECREDQHKYDLPFEDPSFVCLAEDQARDLFANAERNLHLQEQEAKENECSTGKEYDPDEKKCISERLADAKKKKQIEQEEVKQLVGEKIVPADKIQSCDQPNLGVDRCYFDYDPFTGETLFFKERCIIHKDINIPTWGFFEGYYTDLNCKIKIKPAPEVTVVQDSESAREKLRGQTRRIKVQDPITKEGIEFGRKVAPDLIKNKNRPAVTLQGYVDGLAVDEGNLGDVISAVADENNIDRTIIKAIISKESGFNVNAVSPVGAAGLMQLMPHTAKGLGLRNIYRGDEFNEMATQFRLGVINADTFMAFQKEYAADLRKQIAGKSKEELALFDDRFDPEKNLNKGVSYFARAYQYSGEDLGLALVTYNAGLGYVQKNCKGTYSSCSFGANKAIPTYVDSISQEVVNGGPILDTREKILAFVKSVPKEKFIKDLVAFNNGDKKKAFEALGRMDIEPSFTQFSTYLKDAQLDLYSDPEKQGIGKSSIIQNPQFIPQGVKITADLPREKILGIFGGSYTIERSSTALPLWRLKDSKGNVVSGLDNKELFEIFTSQPFAGGSINLPLGDEIRRFDIKSDPKTKVRYFVDKKTKEELKLHEIAEKIQRAKAAP